MNNLVKPLLACCFLTGLLSSPELPAAPRDAGKNDGAVLKLQAMVKTLTAERDAAKAEAVKSAEELTRFEQLKKDYEAAVAAKDAVSKELAAQKSNNVELKDRLDKTHAKLLEVIEKHKEVTQAKAELNQELTLTKAKQQDAEQRLSVCGDQNIKLFRSAKELLERYQGKDTLASLMQDEPLLQFNSVEMENIVQEYEDKLRAGQFKQ